MSTYMGGLSVPKKFRHIRMYIYIYLYIHTYVWKHITVDITNALEYVYIYITQLQCHSKLPAAISPRPSVLPFPPWRLNIAKSQPDARRRRRQESDACHGCYTCKCHNAGTGQEFLAGMCHCHTQEPADITFRQTLRARSGETHAALHQHQ